MGESLHPERGYELNAACVAHAEDAPHLQWNRADVSVGVALRVGGDIGQGQACSLRRHVAHCGSESMIRKRAGQGNTRGGIGHDDGAKARRISRGLINAACNRGGGQERGFETGSSGTSAGGLVRESGRVNDRESTGESTLQREGEVYIGGIAGVSGE